MTIRTITLIVLCTSLSILSKAQSFSFNAAWNMDTNLAPSTNTQPTLLNAANASYGSSLTSYGIGPTSGRIVWTTSAWPVSSSPGNRYVEFALNTTGNSNLVSGSTINFSFVHRKGTNGPQTLQVQVAVNGGSFVNTGGTINPTSYSWSTATLQYPLNTNATSIAFRIVGYNAGGTPANRYLFLDDVTISATNALPVDLFQWKARQLEKTVQLQWATASERNNKGFAVERAGSSGPFEEIIWVNGTGNSSSEQAYAYTDEKPLSGINYYRLRQEDTDGAVNYSPVLTVKMQASAAIQVYPSVVSDQLHLQVLDANQENNIQWEIIDLNGKLLRSGFLNATDGALSVDVADLPGGQYILRQSDGNAVNANMFFKQ